MDAAVTIAVHDHVHLGGAGGAGLRVAAEDAIPREPADTGINRPVLLLGRQKPLVQTRKGGVDPRLLLVGVQALRLDRRAGVVLVGLDRRSDPGADMLEGADQEAT